MCCSLAQRQLFWIGNLWKPYQINCTAGCGKKIQCAIIFARATPTTNALSTDYHQLNDGGFMQIENVNKYDSGSSDVTKHSEGKFI